MMRQSELIETADTLAGLLEELIVLQDALHGVVREKLEAMRRADVPAMEALAAREGELAGQVSTLDVRRREVVATLCGLLDMPPVRDPGGVTLRALLTQMEPSLRDRLSALADRLREKMLNVAGSNHIVEMVSRAMLETFKELFSIMAHDDEQPTTYSATGQSSESGAVRVLDAVV
ncbi:MAG: flagellar protein FlgN [Phycisphaerae bacterium]